MALEYRIGAVSAYICFEIRRMEVVREPWARSHFPRIEDGGSRGGALEWEGWGARRGHQPSPPEFT